MNTMIDIKNVTKTYAQGTHKVYAIKNLSLSVEEMKFIAIMGKSGSGKSTLLHLLGGLDTADSGSIIVDGTELLQLPEKKLSSFRRNRIGFVFQFFNLIPELTARENIIFPVLLTGEKEDTDYIDELIHMLDLEDRIHHLPDELSGGQQQRVAIARAFSTKPSVILMDEPTGNLDEESGNLVLKMILSLKERFRQTILMVTHEPEIAKLADQTIHLVNGEIES